MRWQRGPADLPGQEGDGLQLAEEAGDAPRALPPEREEVHHDAEVVGAVVAGEGLAVPKDTSE